MSLTQENKDLFVEKLREINNVTEQSNCHIVDIHSCTERMRNIIIKINLTDELLLGLTCIYSFFMSLLTFDNISQYNFIFKFDQLVFRPVFINIHDFYKDFISKFFHIVSFELNEVNVRLISSPYFFSSEMRSRYTFTKSKDIIDGDGNTYSELTKDMVKYWSNKGFTLISWHVINLLNSTFCVRIITRYNGRVKSVEKLIESNRNEYDVNNDTLYLCNLLSDKYFNSHKYCDISELHLLFPCIQSIGKPRFNCLPIISDGKI